jgi:spermidine synthase
MGATFPAIVRGSANLDSARRQGTRTGYLYTVNTLGAAAGALLAGYVLLPRLGAMLSLGVACAVSLLAAGGALILQGFARRTPAVISPAAEPQPAAHLSTLERLIVLTAFVIGFISLSYEVLLTRLVILYFGNSLVVFTLVVTAFLLGIGLSAMLGTMMHRQVRSAHGMAMLVVIAGLFLVVPPVLLLALSGESLPYQDVLVGSIMLAPAFVFGGLLPIAIRLFDAYHPLRDVTRSASQLYAANTLGGMLAAMITNAVLVRSVGIAGTLIVLSLICILMGASVLWVQPVTKRWLVVPAGALVMIAVLALGPYNLERLYAQKLTAYSGDDIDPAVKLYHEGAVTTAIVLDFPWLGYRDMFLNGVEEASTRFGHVQLFKLLGLLPVVMRDSDEAAEALMIAFGAGISAGATLGSGLVSSLECVDLNPDIEGINELFKDVNGDVYHDPRFHFVAEDGRNYLQRQSKHYAVIISDSTHPRSYDSWILYTEEFYRLVRSHLTPDGVFAQWVPLSDISFEQYRILLTTFRKVFPNVTLWNIYGTDQAFLLSTPRAFLFDVERIQGRLNRAADPLHLKAHQLDTAIRIGGFFGMDRDAIDRFIGEEHRTNTDDRPYHQKQALGRFTPLRMASFDRYQASLAAHAVHATQVDRVLMADRQVLARTMQRVFFFNDDVALEEAALLDPTDGNVSFHQQRASIWLAMSMERARRNSSRNRAEAALLQQSISQRPGEVRAYADLAELYLKQHRMAEAETLLISGLAHAPDALSLKKALARVYMNMGRWPEATPLLELVLRANSSDTTMRRALIESYARQQNYPKAIELLKAMGPTAEDDYQYYLALAGAHFALAEYPDAERDLNQALSIYPGNTQALAHLAELCFKTGRHEAGLQQLHRLLEIHPYQEAALQRLIQWYRERGGQEDRVASLELALAHAQALRGNGK